MADNKDIRDDHDSPWKEALEHYFPEFVALLFPEISSEIDWTQGFQFLDAELQQVVGDSELGRRYADKLVRVHTVQGRETWVLIHVEVQGSAEANFAQRMFVYYYRLFDRYNVDVISIAVLTDDVLGFHPTHYQRERWGCRLEFSFPVQKLLEWESRWSELETSSNPFSLVVMAHLTARSTRDGATRKAGKFRLIRLMYERGYAKSDVLELFRVIDWIVRLPRGLEREFLQELYAYEKDQRMPYITSAERMGIEQGVEQGKAILLLDQIEQKFGPADPELIQRVQNADPETLRRWARKILTVSSLAEMLE